MSDADCTPGREPRIVAASLTEAHSSSLRLRYLRDRCECSFKTHQNIYHRRSTAERGGCFQRRLFVCLSVCCLSTRLTSERLNGGWWNLAVRCVAQKSRPSSNLGVKGQSSRSPGTKKTKKCAILFVRESSSGAARSLCGIFSAAVLWGTAMPVGKSAHVV